MKLLFSAHALRDLERLRQFIAADNPYAARRMAADLLDGISNLQRFPDVGLPVRRLKGGGEVRDLFVGRYTVRYLRGDEQVAVLRIWHDREDERSK